MREVRGYVFLAHWGDSNPLFGKSLHEEGEELWESFRTNNFRTFDKVKEVIEAKKQYQNNFTDLPIRRTSRAKIYMKIAETKQDLLEFENESEIIVIRETASFGQREKILYGPVNQKNPPYGVLPGDTLRHNGYVPFRTTKKDWTAYKRAMNLVKELNRQGGDPATLALLDLNILGGRKLLK